MSLASRCREQFDHLTRSRGQSYADGGAVKLLDHRGSKVDAAVRGSSGRSYSVNIDRSDLERGVLRATCTCPRFADGRLCKHIWATMLMIDRATPGPTSSGEHALVRRRDGQEVLDAQERDEQNDFAFFEGESDENDDPDEPGPSGQMWSKLLDTIPFVRQPERQPARPSPSGPDRQSPSGPEGNWRKRFAQLSRGRSPKTHVSPWDALGRASRRAWYVLEANAVASGQDLAVALMQQERKKDGEYGKFKTLYFCRDMLDEFDDPADRELLVQLLDCSPRNSVYGYGNRYDRFSYSYDDSSSRRQIAVSLLKPSLYHLLLPKLAQTGRLVLRPGASHPLEAAHVITWDGDAPWNLELIVTADDQQRQWSVTGQFVRGQETIPASSVVAAHSGGLLLLQTKAALFQTDIPEGWIRWALQRTPLIVPYADRDEFLQVMWQSPVLPPVVWPANLTLERICQPPQPQLQVREDTRYGNREYLAADVTFLYGDTAVPPHSPHAGVPQPSGDQGPLERVYLRDLEIERRYVEQLGRLPTVKYSFRQRGTKSLLFKKKLLAAIVDQLLVEGWRVEAEGKLFRTPGNFQIEVQSGIDWFDLQANIDFEGWQVQLPDLLAAVRRGDRYIELGDGSRGMLPTQWLKRYTDVADLGQTTDGKVRFARSQALLLDALLAEQEHAAVDADFARYRRRLQNVDGIAPKDAPASFQGVLRKYQQEGLGWFQFLRDLQVGGCLADDMGLGKTIQVLAWLESRRTRVLEEGEKRLPSLAVVPKSLIFNWTDEASRFTPQLRLLNFTGPQRLQLVPQFEQAQLVLTTYGTLRRDIVTLKDCMFDYVILDEAQAIKNAASQAAKASLLLKSRHRLALTGTPVENHLGELWSLFEFLNPGMLGRSSAFASLCKSVQGNDQDALRHLARAIAPFVLRRTKQQVLDELPPKTEQTIFCELSPKQRKAYDELRDYYRAKLAKVIDARGLQQSKIHVLEALLRLRQAACHPGLIDKKKIHDSSAKLDTLLEQLDETIGEGHKALIFSQFTSLLAIVRDRLDQRKICYEYLDGSTQNRKVVVDRFQNDDSCRVFLISLKAGGQGLNLTAADYVFILDPWWNPAVEMQAIDRTHRIGQSRHVFAYRIIARDTVEEKVLALQESKRELANAIITANDSLIRKLTAEDLQLILG